AREPEAPGRLRRLAPGVHRAGAGGAGQRVPAWPRLRHPGGCAGAGAGRAAPPGAPHLRGRGGGDRHRPGDHPHPRRRPGAVGAPMPPISPEILKQVKAIELRSRGIVSSLFAGEYRSVFRGQGMEFAEVRQYEHGDDFRAIDWNVSARLGHPFVKTFIEEREITLLLVVDQSGSTHFGTPRSKAAIAVEVASILALAAATTNDRVGALLFAEKVERVIPPGKGRRHALRVIRDLVAFAPGGRRTDLAG